jgi:hypothetical protein
MSKNVKDVPKGLEEIAEKVESYYDVGEEHGYLYCHRGDIKDAVMTGARWKEEEIVNEGYAETQVVEDGRIDLEGEPLPCLNPIILLPYPKFKPGDKVKIIIVKEEEL